MKKKNVILTRGSTFILKVALVLIALLGLLFCIHMLLLISDGKHNYRSPVWAGLCVATIPVFVALRQGLTLLNLIDSHNVFSIAAVKALSNIKKCAFVVGGLFVVGTPYIFYVAERDDSPGLGAIALVLVGVSFIIATAAAVFQRLLQNAVDIKSENDLTV